MSNSNDAPLKETAFIPRDVAINRRSEERLAQNDPVMISLEQGVAIITVTTPLENTLTQSIRDALAARLTEAMAGQVSAIVMICAGPVFNAGADIAECAKPCEGTSLGALCKLMEDAPIPVIAAVHGAALGSGLGLALCAHYRIAAQSAACGLPEISLGLIPGGGATQRLPRLVGLDQSLTLLTSGAQVSAQAALAMGLLDEVVPDAELRSKAVSRAVDMAANREFLPRTCDRVISDPDPARIESFRKANIPRFRLNPAFFKVLACMDAAIDGRSFAEGIAFEGECVHDLLVSPQSAALRYLLKAERSATIIPGLTPDIAERMIGKVGIVGAGTMGSGIAMTCADAGLAVMLIETRQDNLNRGLATIRRNYDASVAKGRISSEQLEQRLALIGNSLDMADLADCDLVIEAVFEQFEVKRDVFRKLDTVCKPGAILASNTSAIDINRLAASTSRPTDVIGLHFFSPANVMRLLEIVRGDSTSADVLATALKLGRTLRKVAIVSRVCPGFIANRMLKLRQNQSQLLLLEGAMPWDVDRVLLNFGFPMGPFAMSDLVGLDLGWTLESSTGSTLREVLCENGRRGQKTGAGYYDYDDLRNRKPSPAAERLIRDFVARNGTRRGGISDEEILARCIYPVINEGARILDEGIALRGSDIDVAWINGFGWPTDKGGPMYFADQVGLSQIVDMLERMSKESASVAPPAPLLLCLARQGGKLSEFGS